MTEIVLDVNLNDEKLKQRIRYLEKKLDEQKRTLERVCHRLNLRYNKKRL